MSMVVALCLVETRKGGGYMWPTFEEDPDFVLFARRLSDWVTQAINLGIKVKASNNHHCPLGCAPAFRHTFYRQRPNAIEVNHAYPEISRDNAAEFCNGFDFGSNNTTDSPYRRLGAAYRRRFVEGKR